MFRTLLWNAGEDLAAGGEGHVDVAGDEVGEVGHVQGLDAHQAAEGEVADVEGGAGPDHSVADGPCGGGSDEDAVPHEGQTAECGHDYQPYHIRFGGSCNGCLFRHETYHPLATHAVGHGRDDGQPCSPDEEQADGLVQ